MSFKNIGFEELQSYKDPFSLWETAPVALAHSESGKENGLTIGWGGLGIIWNMPIATIYINKARYSKEIFDDSSCFSICFFKDDHKDAIKYFGTVSGRDEDKIKGCGLTLVRDGDYIYYEEADLVILCDKVAQSDFDIDKIKIPVVVSWYKKDGVHTIYQGQIKKVLKKE